MAGDFSRNKTRNYGMMYLTQSRRDIHQKGLVFGSTKPGLCLEIAGSGEDGSITKRPQCQISLLHGRVQMTRKSIPPKHQSVVGDRLYCRVNAVVRPAAPPHRSRTSA